MNFRKVMCAGTFDHYHLGHQYYLWQARALAEEMVIVVAQDQTVIDIKGRASDNNLESRIKNIEKDFQNGTQVRPGRTDKDFHQTIREENPDLIFLGYDQRFDETKAQAFFPEITFKRCEPYFPGIFKSSYFRKA